MDWTPLGNPSLLTRIAVAKGMGLVIGGAIFFLGPLVDPELDMLTRVGILLWYPTMGAFIGLFGVMNWHPILQLPLPWWFRSVFIGLWLNLLLVFFSYERIGEFLLHLSGEPLSPFWFVAWGGLCGAVMGFTATRFGGEGPCTTDVLHA